jgi:hypothetical protein
VGKRTLVQSLRRLALPTLLACFTLLGLLSDRTVETATAQCTPAACDDITIYDTLNNCVRFKIVNRKPGTLINRIKISTASPYPIGWVCGVTADPTYVTGYTGRVSLNSWTEDVVQRTNFSKELIPTNPATADMSFCDTGYFVICICCPMRAANPVIPVTITTIHNDGPPRTECAQTFNLSYMGPSCIPREWPCRDSCPDLSASTSYDAFTGRSRVCVTITNKQPGSLYYFNLSIACNGAGTANNWQVVDMPSGWVDGGFNGVNGAGGTFSSASGLDNCAEMTFCFETDNCDKSNPCNNITINYVGEGPNGIGMCSLSVNATLTRPSIPATDNSCCALDKFGNPIQPTVDVDPPVVNPTTGKSEFCVTVKRVDATAMNTITISRTIGRTLCLTSIPWGWERTGGSATSDVFTRTTAPNTGCRSFTFCYETCDCDNVNTINGTVNVNYTGSGSGVTRPITIFPDQGTCCTGGPWKEDHASISWSPSAPGCLTYTLVNSHWPCTDVNDFHFGVPLSCIPSSITVPTGFTGTYDPITKTVNVVPTVTQGGVIGCCEEMVVTVCFNNCIGPFPDFDWSWTSTYNGTPITIKTQPYHYSLGPVMQSKVRSAHESQKGEQNYPNPFGASTLFKTTIPFNASGIGIARIRISDPTGKLVLTEEMEVDAAGKRFFYFTGEDLPAGTYYYEIEFPKGKQVVAKRTMILVK